MKAEKKVIGRLNKCYSLAEITVNGKRQLAVAAEKHDPCWLFDLDGTKTETVWEEPGGVMTMQQVPGQDGQFIATHRFYSPNDSKEACLVLASREEGAWSITELTKAPFVHRFGILGQWLIVCCLKSGHEHKEDWSSPGAVYAARLPEDMNLKKHPLELHKIRDGLLKNHGFSLSEANGIQQAVIGTESGTFLFTPPQDGSLEEWQAECILPVPSSDSVLIDLDGDGQPELGTISPFHGNSVNIWHLDENGTYIPAWKLPLPESDSEMVHATWAGTLNGKPVWVVGWRKGTRQTIAISWNPETGSYEWEVIDQNAGAANIMKFTDEQGTEKLLAANREINEIAVYTIGKEA